MLKSVSLSIIILLILSSTAMTQERLAKYPKIEGYEIRPGILLIARYTVDNEVCEIGLEKLHYSPEIIRSDSELSRKEIDEIFDEVVPADESGKPLKDSAGNLMTQSGQILITGIDYENVSLLIYGATLPSNRNNVIIVNEFAATIKWKHRICR